MLANGGWDLIRAPTNASKWRMGFNSAFKGLNAKMVRFKAPVLLGPSKQLSSLLPQELHCSYSHNFAFNLPLATFVSKLWSEDIKWKVMSVRPAEDRWFFQNGRLVAGVGGPIHLLLRNWFTACFIWTAKRWELDGWSLSSRLVATLQVKVLDKPVIRSLLTRPLNE